jgi:hypothetical protein
MTSLGALIPLLADSNSFGAERDRMLPGNRVKVESLLLKQVYSAEHLSVF